MQTVKERILYYAKKEFYEKGYIHTTLKDIAKLAECQPSQITYHYKTKDLLVSEIYTDYYQRLYSRMDEYPHLCGLNSLLKKIIHSQVYYTGILNDPNNVRMYTEVLEKKFSNYELNAAVTNKIYWEIAQDFDITLTEMEFDIICSMRAAARAAFFRYYFKEKPDLNISEIVRFAETIAPSLMGIDVKVIDSYLIRSIRLVRDIECSDICFLV